MVPITYPVSEPSKVLMHRIKKWLAKGGQSVSDENIKRLVKNEMALGCYGDDELFLNVATLLR